ncbi:hypothetical protein [Caulobacter segnis]
MKTLRGMVFGLALLAGGNAAQAADAERFVQLYRSGGIIAYWDAGSVRRLPPDGYALRILRFSYSYTAGSGSPDWTRTLDVEPFEARISCGWRTVQKIVDHDDMGRPVSPPAPSPAGFLSSSRDYAAVADSLCSDKRLPDGGLTREEARDAVVAALGPQSPGAPSPMPPPSSEPPALEVPAWVRQPHAFMVVKMRDPEAEMYVDRLSIRRSGAIVEALALTTLRDAPPRHAGAELRLTRYDCDHSTATALARAIWNGYGALVSVEAEPSVERDGLYSPLVVFEARSVCGRAKTPSSTSFPDVPSAMLAFRSKAPLPRKSWRIDCLWNGLTVPQRAAWMDHWRTRHQTVYASLRGPMVEVARGCEVQAADDTLAAQALRQRAIQYVAVLQLQAKRPLSFEARLVAAWETTPKVDRLRFAQPWAAAIASERTFQLGLIQRIGRSLALSEPELDILADYLRSLAQLETNMGVTD